MKKISFLIFSLFCVFEMICSQENTGEIFDTPQYTPTAPNIASLGKYGEFTVGHYSGTPVIEVPLYEIDLDGLKIPITLTYNASGVKVAQEASWVGLGWSLNVGGTISKEIRGWNDFGQNDDNDQGYYYRNASHWPEDNGHNQIENPHSRDLTAYYNPFVPFTNDMITGSDMKTEWDYFFEELFTRDTQPDMYYFNFGKYSGTMYFGAVDFYSTNNLPLKPIVQCPTARLDISYDIPTQKWVATDPYGFKYYFNPGNTSRVYENSSETFNPNYFNGSIPSLSERQKMPLVITSWLIDCIESPKGNKITFQYEAEYIKTPLSVSEPLSLSGRVDGGSTEIGRERIHCFKYSQSQICQSRLKRVVFDGGSVEFGTIARNDLQAWGQTPQKLNSIDIKDKVGNPVKSFGFEYDYMGTVGDYLSSRLMLKSVYEKWHTEKNGVYKFSYIEGNLPAKNSNQTDPWGYYNGPLQIIGCNDNTHDHNLHWHNLPPMTTNYLNNAYPLNNPNAYPIATFTPGKCILPDVDYMKIGTLSDIEYPTGGKTHFTYETHDFPQHFSTYTGYTGGGSANFGYEQYFNPSVPNNQANVRTMYGEEFTIDRQGYIQMSGYYHRVPNVTPKDRNLQVNLIKKQSDGNKIVLHSSFNCYASHDGEMEELLNNLRVYVPYGTYQVEIIREIDPSTNLPLNFPFSVGIDVHVIKLQEFNYGGGLRIKEIVNTDKNNFMSKKRYSYGESGSYGGVLLSVPDFAHTNIYDTNTGLTGLVDLGTINLGLFSNIDYSVNRVSLYGAVPEIRYRYVEERLEDNAGNTTGKNVYRYYSQPAPYELMPGYPVIQDPANGSLLQSESYDSHGYPVKVTEKHYKIWAGDTDKEVQGLVTGPNNILPPMAKFYYLHSERCLLDYETTKIYQPNSWTDYVESTTHYQYHPDCWAMNNIQTIQSDKKTLEKTMTYANDYTDAVSEKMKTNNMIGMPIETTSKINDRVISYSKTLYYDTLGIVLPKLAFSSINPQPATTENYRDYSQYFKDFLRYDKYDAKGNVEKYTNKDGKSIIILRGYNNSYPIAKIENATYEQVETVVKSLFSVSSINALANLDTPNEDKLKDGSLQGALPNSLVTTYTYKPLKGVNTITDPRGITTYYGYDDFGRLNEIYYYEDGDTNKKRIVETNNYHYRLP